MQKIKVGISGCGTIGSELARALKSDFKESLELVALYDVDKGKGDKLSSSLGKKVLTNSVEELFDKSDLVIEAAAAGIACEMVKKAVEKSKEIMVMSVGGLIGSLDLLEEAKKKGIKVHIPSGAICGIDGLKAAKIAGIESVTLTTKKPPRGLVGAPYLEEKKIDLSSLDGEKVVFEGSAEEAVRAFPKNVNVSSVLSLTGIGAEKTKVRIVTSPEFSRNTHEIEIKGEFGTINTRTENVPSKNNPKTSRLAILSAMAVLKSLTESVKIGT